MCCCNNNANTEDVWVFGHQFTSTTQYANPLLRGRYRVKMRGLGFLIRGSEWDYLPNGGFEIFVVPGWVVTNDVKILVQFY